MAKLTSETSETCAPRTCEGSPNATSSPASVDGPTRSDLPDGLMTEPVGLVPARAARGAWQEKGLAPTIRATFGLRGFASSSSAALTRSLVSRLKVRLDGHGSTAFALTWKRVDMPSGRSVSLLRASGLPKGANGSGSWQTPTTRDGKGQSGRGNRLKRAKNGRMHVANLCDQLVDIGRPDLVRSTRFRCWLMGYPESWERVRATAMPSSRRSPRSS
jgi:hypothetical protein